MTGTVVLCWMYTLSSGNGYTLAVFRRKRDIYGGEFSYCKVGAGFLGVD